MSAEPLGTADAVPRDVTLPDGRALRAYLTGDPAGLPVIVHHGTPCSGLLAPAWAADAAARGIRLIGFDRAGYGGSSRQPGRGVAEVAADTAALADTLGVHRFRTWGVSGGGPHALACAALLPDRVIAVASVAGIAPREADGLDWLAGMGQDNLDEFGAAHRGEVALRAYLASVRQALLSATPASLADAMDSLLPEVDRAALAHGMDQFVHAWMATGIRENADGWVDDDLAFVRDWGFDLGQVNVPTLVLQGEADLMVPKAHSSWLAAHVPGAQLRLEPGHGHLSLLDSIGTVHQWLLAHG